MRSLRSRAGRSRTDIRSKVIRHDLSPLLGPPHRCESDQHQPGALQPPLHPNAQSWLRESRAQVSRHLCPYPSSSWLPSLRPFCVMRDRLSDCSTVNVCLGSGRLEDALNRFIEQALYSASDCWADSPSTSAREKLATM